ncbi:MAG: MFS transporter [Pseudomonadales bacterium]|nr:MFS transporter [Pseudomonadales bacterium]
MNNTSLAWRLGLLSCLYFSQGLPFGFFTQALPPILRQYGVDLEKIGLISLIAVPWAFKFLWAPYVDQYGSALLGRRKSWILPMQCGFVLLLVCIAFINPETLSGNGLYYLLGLLFLANLFAATQDIATDGLAVQSLRPAERGFGNSIQVGGYRVGMVFGGGLLLLLMDWLGWQQAFFVMAATIVLVTVPVFFHREHDDLPVLGAAGPGGIWALFTRYLRQPNIIRWLIVVIFYKAADSFGSAMSKPFLIDLGLDLATIGWLSGGLGIVAGIIGAIVGGLLIPRIGRVRALVAFGLIQALSFVGYGALVWFIDPTIQAIAVVSTFEHFTGGLATVALFTAMMDACRPQTAGTDYTIQASIQVCVGGGLHAISGFVAAAFGYGIHFLIASGMGILVLFPVLLWARSQHVGKT